MAGLASKLLALALTMATVATSVPALLMVPTPGAPNEWYIAHYPEAGSFTAVHWRDVIHSDAELIFRDSTGDYVLQAGFFQGLTKIFINHYVANEKKKPEFKKNQETMRLVHEHMEMVEFYRKNYWKKFKPLGPLDETWLLTHERYWDLYLKSETSEDLHQIIEHIKKYGVEILGDKLSRAHEELLKNLIKEWEEKVREEIKHKQAIQQAQITSAMVAIGAIFTIARRLFLGI